MKTMNGDPIDVQTSMSKTGCNFLQIDGISG